MNTDHSIPFEDHSPSMKEYPSLEPTTLGNPPPVDIHAIRVSAGDVKRTVEDWLRQAMENSNPEDMYWVGIVAAYREVLALFS